MTTKTIKLADLNENHDNPRTITDEQLHKLMRSLVFFPSMLNLRPIIASADNTILGGNMRYRALSRLAAMDGNTLVAFIRDNAPETYTESDIERTYEYWEHLTPESDIEVVTDEKLTPDERDQFIIKDNLNYGDWDIEKLTGDFSPLQLMEWGLEQDPTRQDEPTDKPDDMRVIITFRSTQAEDLAAHLRIEPRLRAFFDFNGTILQETTEPTGQEQ